jgi:hypothetical protein
LFASGDIHKENHKIVKGETMNKLTTLALAILILASGFFYSTARAATVSDCQALITQTRNDLAGVTSIGGRDPAQTKANLDEKLFNASAKLDEGKPLDAIAKLIDFRTAVENMAAAAKPKIAQAEAALLNADANNAIACIQT